MNVPRRAAVVLALQLEYKKKNSCCALETTKSFSTSGTDSLARGRVVTLRGLPSTPTESQNELGVRANGC